jgi:hypothetical protein
MIGATVPGRDRAIRASVRALRDGGIDVPILVGGAAITDAVHARRLGADAWSGRDARTAIASVDAISAAAARRA